MLLYATIDSLLLCIACVDVVPGKTPITPLVNMSKMNNVDGKALNDSLCPDYSASHQLISFISIFRQASTGGYHGSSATSRNVLLPCDKHKFT